MKGNENVPMTFIVVITPLKELNVSTATSTPMFGVRWQQYQYVIIFVVICVHTLNLRI